MSETKASIRQQICRAFKEFGPAMRLQESRQLCGRLLLHPRFAAARTLGIFLPLPDEPDLSPLYAQFPGQLALPFPADEGWRFHHVTDLTPTTTGPFGLMLPSPGPAVEWTPADLILVPGRAFSAQGQRIGRGAGIYDRLLASSPAWTLGIAFSIQLFPALPQECHDAILNEVILP